MQIVIGHLFYDLLNLYGENGNVLAIKNALTSQGIEVEIRNFSLDNEPWNLEDLDIICIGAGTETNQLMALDVLKNYKEVINEFILNNNIFLATGNSIELFGKSIKINNTNVDALNIFEFETQRTEKRVVSECVFKYNEIQDKILGFENHQGYIYKINNPLFTIEKGFSSEPNSNFEGIRVNNFYGTYLLGPLLARNPKLLEKICKDVILSKDANFEFKHFDFVLEQRAHDEFLIKYTKD